MDKSLGLRERNKADKLLRIKSSAKQLFERQGYDSTTTKQIADVAGIAAGTVFLYAKTKDEILYLIYEEDLTRVREAAYAAVHPGANLLEGVYTVFAGFFKYYGESPELARAFIRRFVFIDPMMSERYMSFQHDTFEKIASLVIRAQTRGEAAPDIDPLVAVSNFWAIYCSCLVFFLQAGSVSIESGLAHLRRSLELMCTGLCSESAQCRDVQL